MQKAYQKYNVQVPTNIAAAAAAVSGTVAANPEQYDAEYLRPVTVGGTTLNLNFDTRSADLWVFSDQLPTGQRGQHGIYKTSSGMCHHEHVSNSRLTL
jgi:aspergillopepsin I